MKKTGVIPVLILFLIILVQIFYVSAQTAPGLESLENDSLFGTVQTGTEKAGEFQAAENKSDFLKAQWGEILSKNTLIGPILRFLDKISPVTNPIFKYTFGLEPSLSWLFFFVVIIWIVFFMYVRASMQYSPFSPKTAFIISLGLTIIFGVSGAIRSIAQKIIDLASLITAWWGQIIIALIVILFFITAGILSRNLSKSLKAAKEKKKKEELEKRVEETEVVTKEVSKVFEEVGKV